MVKVAIVGASGYAGAELCRMVSQHDDLELTGLLYLRTQLIRVRRYQNCTAL